MTTGDGGDTSEIEKITELGTDESAPTATAAATSLKRKASKKVTKKN